MKLHIKKGDTVIVNSGEFRGQKGTVLQVLVKKNRAIVEGVNIVSKAVKPSAQNNEGGFVKKEAPIHISNLMLICPETGKPTRIGRKKVEVNGVERLVRYSKKSKDQKEIK
ncbi:MAG: 50S ribosomal protein L24 [Bacteroidales bacterium]|jgi:large subunit ribosomal protein L24|nr:50S ribosomal protein L24 [Bacteroidales bacterium]MBQ5549872.1 50S ribosomal protein L24 [Bacteroidales bacterium]MBR2200250.1 50S ribosomal protein L24 [Bacteroidales bacterium]MBR3713477.1 50S ribosomal protein L24 [Bacteroidales bacterium]